MRRQPPSETVGQQIRKKLFAALIPAVAGAFAGYTYARYNLDPKLLESSALPAMYASMGAILGVLGIRVASLLRVMFTDFFQK